MDIGIYQNVRAESRIRRNRMRVLPSPRALATAVPVTEFPGYLVAPDSTIISMKAGQPFVMRQGYAGVGYRSIKLCRDGRLYTRYVHRIVCAAFHGPCPKGCETRHLDGNRSNNHRDNLIWGTHRENIDDMVRHGRVLKGESNLSAKLTGEDVRKIREMASRKVPHSRIAERFGVARSQIWLINTRQTWRHVET